VTTRRPAQLRRRSLAKLRQEAEPVDQSVPGACDTAGSCRATGDRHRCAAGRHRATARCADRRVDSGNGNSSPRVSRLHPRISDSVARRLSRLGRVEPFGDRDGRIALYLVDSAAKLLRPTQSGRSVRLQRTRRSTRSRDPRSPARTRRSSSSAPRFRGRRLPAEKVNALGRRLARRRHQRTVPGLLRVHRERAANAGTGTRRAAFRSAAARRRRQGHGAEMSCSAGSGLPKKAT